MDRSIVILFLCAVASLTSGAADGGPGRGPGYRANASYVERAKTDYWREWRTFVSNFEVLQKSPLGKNAEASRLLTQIQTNVLFLQTKWDAWFLKHSLDKPEQAWPYDVAGDDYLHGLQADSRLLSGLKREKDEQKAVAILRDVALDVQVKADNCRNSGDGLGKIIKVKVRTTAAGREVGGFEVYYVQKGMLDVKRAHDRFARLSSPTDERILAPGGYAMWVRKGEVLSEPVTLRVGGNGEERISVDLEVPSEQP